MRRSIQEIEGRDVSTGNFVGNSQKVEVVKRLPKMSAGGSITHRYEGWTHDHTMRATTRRFVPYNTLSALLAQWREVRLSIIEHSATVLSQISTLGEREFYGRNKRFGGVRALGDIIYIDLSNARIQMIRNNIITALQTVSGEGRQKRLGNGNNQNTGSDDSALNVAHQLSELDELLVEPTFLSEACYTQEKFELVNGLTWTS